LKKSVTDGSGGCKRLMKGAFPAAEDDDRQDVSNDSDEGDRHRDPDGSDVADSW